MLVAAASVAISMACGGSGDNSAVRQAAGAFNCPSPPMPAIALTACENSHSLVNHLTLTVPTRGGQVTGAASVDGLVGSLDGPAEADPANCLGGQRLTITISGGYDRLGRTITGTFSVDATPTAGTCSTVLLRPSHNEVPFKATVDGDTITGQSGVLFFEATLE
jgi:hypothetical protein